MLLNARNGKMDEIWNFNVIDLLLFRKKTKHIMNITFGMADFL